MNDPVLEKAGELLADVAGQLDEPPAIVTNAVLLVEYVDVDGDKWLRTFRNTDIKTWEMRGMLSAVLSDMDAFDVVWALEDDE